MCVEIFERPGAPGAGRGDHAGRHEEQGCRDPDVTFVVDLGPLEGTYTGKDGVPRFFGKMTELYHGTLRVDVVDIVAGDHHGIVLTRESGTVHDEQVQWTSAHVWTFTQGGCNRFTAYVSADYQRFWAEERATAR